MERRLWMLCAAVVAWPSIFPGVRTFEFEIYWGTGSGVLLHDTIEVLATDYAEAEAMVFRDRPIPKPGYVACAPRDYFESYYDFEFLGELSVAE